MGEIWDGSKKEFVKNTFNQLLGYVAGKDASSVDTLTSTMTAEQMRNSTNGGKEAGKDIVVRLGGLDWTVTYLSTDKSGNPILTLWLTNNEQDAWQTDANIHKSDAGDYYGFALGPQTNKYGLYSDWSRDWYSSSTPTNGNAEYYPSNMYGTSYIRSVTLNNGGQYATSNTTLATDPGQDANNVFAKFTMPSVEGNLTEFLVKPSQVSWQENQSAKETSSFSYKCANDELNPADDTGYYSAAYNYAEHNGYDAWANDYIWLPSISETGHSGSHGLWKASNRQRQNYNGSTNSFTVDRIGTTQNQNYATTANTLSWLRSAFFYYAYRAYNLYPSGSSYNNSLVSLSCAVRPALHLNLSEAASTVVMTWDDYAAESYASGSGTAVSPYIIKTSEQMAKLAKDSRSSNLAGVNFKLAADIDMRDHLWDAISDFGGVFDGDKHTISGISSVEGKNQGLFGLIIAPSCTIKNLFITNSVFYSSTNVGTFCAGVERVENGGECNYFRLQNCIAQNITIISSDKIGHDSVGGLCGYVRCSDGLIENCMVDTCYISTDVAGLSGALAGTLMAGSTIKNSCALNVDLRGSAERDTFPTTRVYDTNCDCYGTYVEFKKNGIMYKEIKGTQTQFEEGFFYNAGLNKGYPIPRALVSFSDTSMGNGTYVFLTSKGFQYIEGGVISA